jgi:hypothetical protein
MAGYCLTDRGGGESTAYQTGDSWHKTVRLREITLSGNSWHYVPRHHVVINKIKGGCTPPYRSMSILKIEMYGRFKAHFSIRQSGGQSETSSRASASSSRKGRFTSRTSVNIEPRLHNQWVFLTYSKCSLESKNRFEEGLSEMLQRNDFPTATYYGCREHHETEGIHYHVLVNLGKQPNWSFKRAQLKFNVRNNECDSLHISTPRAKLKVGDCIGQLPTSSVEKQQERKQKWKEIVSQPTAPARLAKLKENFPDVFYKCSLTK